MYVYKSAIVSVCLCVSVCVCLLQEERGRGRGPREPNSTDVTHTASHTGTPWSREQPEMDVCETHFVWLVRSELRFLWTFYISTPMMS